MSISGNGAFVPRTVILAELAMEFWGGRLLTSLAQLGVHAGDIDTVLYSHLHIDHVGWTTDREHDGLTFDRARHVMMRAEWEHWRTRPGAGEWNWPTCCWREGPTRTSPTSMGQRRWIRRPCSGT